MHSCVRTTRLLITATGLYVALLLTLTHLPLNVVLTQQQRVHLETFRADTIIHCCLYTVLTTLSLLCARPLDIDKDNGDIVLSTGRLLAVFVAIMCFAVCDEVTQPWFGRNCELLDLAADFTALFPGMCLFLMVHLGGETINRCRA